MLGSIEKFLDNLLDKITSRLVFLIANKYFKGIALKFGLEEEKIKKIEQSSAGQKQPRDSKGQKEFRSADILNRFLEFGKSRKELTIILTHRCNLSCAYCLRDAGSECHDEIPYPKLEEAILAAHRMGVRNAGITGGEAFLYSRWRDLVKLLAELEWRVLWETNGILINDDILEFIKKKSGERFTFLVSLDSHKGEIHSKFRGEGSFESAVKAIRLIKSHGFYLRTNAVVHSLNPVTKEEDLVEHINFNKSLEVDCVSLSRVVGLGRGRNQDIFALSDGQIEELRLLAGKYNFFDSYLKGEPFPSINEDHGCERIGNELCLSPRGVHPCIFHENIKLAEIDDFENVISGDFLKTLNILRLASITEHKHKYFGCAGCVLSLSSYIRKVQNLQLLNSPSGPAVEFSNHIVIPQSLSVLLTRRCNLNCDFCEFECSPEKTAAIDINDFEKLLEEGKKNGISKIVLDGGEPLIYEHIKEAMCLCYRYGYDVTVLTNGWHFEDYLPQFKKYNISSFIFGINGATAETNDRIMGKEGAFERVVKAIKKSKELGFFTGLHLVIHPSNIKELDKFFKLAKGWGVDYIMTSRIIEVGRAKDNLDLKITPAQVEEVRKIYQKHQNSLNKIQFFGAYIGEKRFLQCKYLARDGHLSIHWNGGIALCSMTPLLNLPFKKIRDYSLPECLAAMNEVNKKFQKVRDKEFSKWRLPENPYFSCEYCHERLNRNFKEFFKL